MFQPTAAPPFLRFCIPTSSEVGFLMLQPTAAPPFLRFCIPTSSEVGPDVSAYSRVAILCTPENVG